MAAATPATGTRGQIPGVGARGQRKRRNPVNAPRTWRGSRTLASNQGIVPLAASARVGTSAAVTLGTPIPLTDGPFPAGSIFPDPRQFPGVAGAVTGIRAVSTLRLVLAHQGRAATGSSATAAISVTQVLAGTPATGTTSSATLSVAVPLAGSAPTGVLALSSIQTAAGTLLTRAIPGVGAKGQPRRRNPVNAPRTWRGSRQAASGSTQVPLQAVGTSVTGVSATATDSVAVPLAGVARVGVRGAGTFTAGTQLHAAGRAGSSAFAALTVTPTFSASSAFTGTAAIGTVTVAPTTVLQRRIPGVGAKGQPRRRRPVNAPRTFRGSHVGVAAPQPITLQATAQTGTAASAIFFVLTLSFEGFGVAGSRAAATIKVTVPQQGAGRTASSAAGSLSVGALFQGRGRSGSRAQATLSATPSANALALTGTRGAATLQIAAPIALTDAPVPGPATFPGPRQLPGEAGSITRTAAPATLTLTPPFAATGITGVSATAAITTQSTTLLDRRILGVGAKGEPRRRRPVNAPRTFRGSRVPTRVVPVAFQSLAASGTLGSAIFFVLLQSLQSSASTGSRGTATLHAAVPLAGAGTTGTKASGVLRVAVSLRAGGVAGSRGRGTLSASAPFNAISFTGTTGRAATIITIPFAGTSTVGTRATGRARLTIPMAGSARTGSRATAAVTVGPIAMSARANTGTRGAATPTLLIAFVGRARAGSRATASITVTVPVHGIATSATLAFAQLTNVNTTVTLTARGAAGTLGAGALVVAIPDTFALHAGFVRPRQLQGVSRVRQESLI